MQIKTKMFGCHTANSKPVKQEVNGTVILPPFSVPCINRTISISVASPRGPRQERLGIIALVIEEIFAVKFAKCEDIFTSPISEADFALGLF